MIVIHEQTETLNIKIYDQMNQRQILFRGLTASNEWVEGCLIYDFESSYTSQFIEDVPPRTWQIFDFDGHRHEVIESSIGQFTGLLDKNGKKIFEGDICEILHPCWSATCETNFNDGAFWFIEKNNPVNNSQIRADKFLKQPWEIKVVGNIHDTPNPLQP